MSRRLATSAALRVIEMRLKALFNDRANEEVFICENGDPNLKFFPVEAVYKRWREDHLDSVMKTTDRLSSTIQAQKDAPKRQLFWPET